MKRYTSIIITITIILGGVFIFNAFGLWQTESTKEPIKTAEGFSDPGDIRGSYSFKDIEKSFDITVAYLAEAYHVKENPEEFQLKSLEGMYEATTIDGTTFEIGTGSVRYFVYLVTGIKSNLVEADFLPQTAVDMLLRDGYITETSEAVSWGVDVKPTQTDKIDESNENASEEPMVKGNTTVQDIVNLGVDINDLEGLLETELERGDLIKNICAEQGLSFSEIKTAISDLIK